MKYCFCCVAALGCALLVGCRVEGKMDPNAGAPPPAKVERQTNEDVFQVSRPEQVALVSAGRQVVTPELNATGTVSPDVSRAIPVISLATGRILEIHARLGDTVTKGRLLMKVQSADISQAFSDYRQAMADEVLAKAQLERSKLLYEKGAIAQKDLEVAVDTENKAAVTVETTVDHLKVLGADPQKPTAIVEVRAPVSGVITDQQVTTAAGTQGLASPNAFTISDLSHVWIICDVYENDLHFVRIGEYADIHLNAYPDMVLRGRISNIGPILDPALRTAKVRLEVGNPGMLRLGMFVTASFHSEQRQTRAVVPSTAILHMHDRRWVYIPMGGKRFRRVEVNAGELRKGNLQLVSGIVPGQPVVENALVFDSTVEP